MSYFLKGTEPEHGSGQLQKSYEMLQTMFQISETIAVASLFNFMDRMADALGAPVEGLQEMMKQMSDT